MACVWASDRDTRAVATPNWRWNGASRRMTSSSLMAANACLTTVARRADSRVSSLLFSRS
jgi:hypothetical protein